VLKIPTRQLCELRDRLQARGQRPSMMSPRCNLDVVEAMAVVQEYGDMCEAMYLMMAADRRVRNVEREVMRGALDVLSDNRVRTAHMEAMIDASARRAARHGADACLARVIESLRCDPVRAETTVVLAAAVAVADDEVTPAEHELLRRLVTGLQLGEERANEILEELLQGT
jgi:tellurite resistance protein